ncbi:MAG: hypothetical protein HC915_17750 [Anaerolineae bacterium]|nr:hypothetical protein [Anaerolineae bacterium]
MSSLIGTRQPVLDRGWVELQAVLGSDLEIVNAARTSFLGESKGEERDKKLLFYLMQHRHDGPFEMAVLKFRIHAPEVVWRQLLRHRTGSYNLQSYRYMEAEAEEFYLPQAWRLQALSNKQASAGALDGRRRAAAQRTTGGPLRGQLRALSASVGAGRGAGTGTAVPARFCAV